MRKINFPLLISLVFSFLMIINYQVIKHSQLVKIYDESRRVILGLNFYDLLFKSPGITVASRLDSLLTPDIGQAHPHFFEFMEAVCWRILEAIGVTGSEKPLILLTNAVFLFILLFSVYGIGSVVYNKKVGFLAALLVSMFPLVFSHSRVAMLDFPLTCMVSLSFFLLLKTNGFQLTFYSILSGIIFGLSQLTKEAAILFILPVLIYYFIWCYIRCDKKKALLNFIIYIASFLIVAGSAYLRIKNQHIFATYLSKVYIDQRYNYAFYLYNFRNYLGPFILILILPLFFGYIANFKKREKLFFFWFFVPLVLFSIFPNRELRFIMPVLPALALIAAQEIFSNSLLRKAKLAYGALLVFASVLQYSLFNCGIFDFTVPYNECETLAVGIPHIKKEKYLPVVQKILDVFKNEAPAYKSPGRIVFLFNNAKIHPHLRLEFKLFRLPFYADCPFEQDAVDILKNPPVNCDKDIMGADYVIDKPKDTGGIKKHNYKIAEQIRECFNKHKDQFKIIAEIKSLDESIIYIYKKKINGC